MVSLSPKTSHQNIARVAVSSAFNPPNDRSANAARPLFGDTLEDHLPRAVSGGHAAACEFLTKDTT
jgi:hypothetical protein